MIHKAQQHTGTVMRLNELTEVRSDDEKWDDTKEYDELLVGQRIVDYFIKRGYGWLGEGREQVALLSPRDTVVKILGKGPEHREEVVRKYVEFFQRNQRNPHYPRIYSTNDFNVGDHTYFIYEMEYLHYVADEEETLEYLEDLMASLGRYGQRGVDAHRKNKPLPPGLTNEQVDGLVIATEDLIEGLGGIGAGLDLSAIENLGRRENGQIVIIDPFSAGF